MLGLVLVGCGEAPEPAQTSTPDPCPSLGTAGYVDIDSGPRWGTRAGETCAFEGIEYAGAGRFMAPTAPARWSVPRGATAFGPACLQVDSAGVVSGSEECLSLNVWVPRHDPAESLPVALFLHGGGNVSGSSAFSTYDGRELAARGRLVVVTANYRLGALGYLAHPALSAENTPPRSGNYGLLDQIAVLEWIRNNIAAFGGDRERVLVFGQSAGARNLCALLVSPRASSLFQRAIIQSGACEFESLAASEAFGVVVGRTAGCPDGSTASCLRSLSPITITTALPSLPSPLDSSRYNPNIDGVTLEQAPIELLPVRPRQTPVLVTTTSEEVGHVVDPIADAAAYERWVTTIYGTELGPQILAMYPAADYESPQAALVALITDSRYACPARRTARQASVGGPTYRLLFARGLDQGERAAYGSYHGLELSFVFRSFEADGYVPGQAELARSDAIIATYSRFAYEGSPEGGALPFEPYDWTTEAYTRFDDAPGVEHWLQRSQCNFWDSLSP